MAQSPPEESSLELREKSLVLLSEALDDIKDKLAYDEAQRMATEEGSTTFVNDEAFRLRFLRAEQFRPKQAAERMIRNLDLLYRYVGPEGLKRPIRLSDLDESSLSLLKAGSFQLLPCRDRSGRTITKIAPYVPLKIKREELHQSLDQMLQSNVPRTSKNLAEL